MEQLLVSHWHRNTKYEIQNIDGTEYIVPCEYGSVYDPIKNENNMMTDALNLGKYLTENDLGQNEMVLDFVHEYGLLGIMPDIAGSDIGRNERVIVCDNIFVESGTVEVNEFAKQFFPLDNVDILDKINKKGKLRLNYRSPIYSTMFLRKYRYCEPLEWVKKYFKYMYSFTIGKKSKMAEFIPPRLTFKIDDRNGLNLLCEYDSLKAMIDLAFAKAVTDDRKPLRTCKHCGKLFYATDIRSEFCSARCRNQYNVYKSRAKHN
ncbi:hypothetical protein [Ruminococcus sp.]|uniref:hypothetical protein n=1 Tax=Ruminococcus sp. TaxID=41978 RepID=UPI0025CF9C93|nr:hypothetical protein [Ruminococcus sp.]MBR1432089.1 hypothetical protein [Ruminococcus sp.]